MKPIATVQKLRTGGRLTGMLGILASPQLAWAQDASLNAGDTAWILTATALVLFMSLPGLALFYGGLVRAKNYLSVLMKIYAIAALASIVWVIAGLSGTIPESVFLAFQMTFAVITPGLIVGAFVERVKFLPVLIFTALWLLVVYAPVTHWIWGGVYRLWYMYSCWVSAKASPMTYRGHIARLLS